MTWKVKRSCNLFSYLVDFLMSLFATQPKAHKDFIPSSYLHYYTITFHAVSIVTFGWTIMS